MVRKAKVVLMVLICVGFSIAAGCAPAQSAQSASSSSPETEEEAIQLTEWSMDSDCTVCHRAESETLSGEGVQMPNGHQGMDCVTCHVDGTTLRDVHEEASGEREGGKGLVSTEVGEFACFGCHDSWEDLAELTAGSSVLTDESGTVVNPHDLPKTSNHEGISCSDCHSMHSDKPLAKTAYTFCIGCHHEKVFECNTCHA